MTLALSSDFPSTTNEELLARIRAIGEQPRIAWVTGTQGRAVHFPVAKLAFWRLGIALLECVDLALASFDQNTSLQESYDAVYLSGGDPVVFRESLRRSGFDDRLRDFITAGGFVSGASGGSMQLTSNVSLFRLLSEPVESVISLRADYEGLGLVDFELLPHLNRHNEAFLEKVRRYSELVPSDVVALADGAALICGEDGAWRCSGEGARFRRGERSHLAGSFNWVRTL